MAVRVHASGLLVRGAGCCCCRFPGLLGAVNAYRPVPTDETRPEAAAAAAAGDGGGGINSQQSNNVNQSSQSVASPAVKSRRSPTRLLLAPDPALQTIPEEDSAAAAAEAAEAEDAANSNTNNSVANSNVNNSSTRSQLDAALLGLHDAGDITLTRRGGRRDTRPALTGARTARSVRRVDHDGFQTVDLFTA